MAVALSCAPSDLVSAASCFTCEIEGQLNPINTYLLAQILLALDPMADVSVQALITGAGCLQCLTPGQLSFINTYLLCQIAAGGGGGGGSPLLNGNGSPLGSVAGAKGQRYHDDLDGAFYTNLDGTVNGWAVG